MTKTELIEIVVGTPLRGDVDDMVYETASERASAINNSGIERQIDYLLENGWSVAEIAKELDLE